MSKRQKYFSVLPANNDSQVGPKKFISELYRWTLSKVDLTGNKRGKLQQDPCKCGSESDIFQRVPISNNWPSPLTPKHHNRKHSYHAVGVLQLWKVWLVYLICKNDNPEIYFISQHHCKYIRNYVVLKKHVWRIKKW